MQIKVADNGEIMVKSAGLLGEYYKNPAATAEVLTADGWYHTSDAGFLDAHGHLKIIDRVKDVAASRAAPMMAPCSRPSTWRTSSSSSRTSRKWWPRATSARRSASWSTSTSMPWATGPSAATALRRLPDLAQKPEVYELIRDCIEKVNADLANDALLAGSQVSRFLVLHKELTPTTAKLTRTNKVRRGFIAEKYAFRGGRPVRRPHRAVHRDPGEV